MIVGKNINFGFFAIRSEKNMIIYVSIFVLNANGEEINKSEIFEALVLTS